MRNNRKSFEKLSRNPLITFVIILLSQICTQAVIAQTTKIVPGHFVTNRQVVVSGYEEGCRIELGDNFSHLDLVENRAECWCFSNPGNVCALVDTVCPEGDPVVAPGFCEVPVSSIRNENCSSSCTAGVNVGNPINALAGNKHQFENDFKGQEKVFPLIVSRTYNSLRYRNAVESSGWSFSMNQNLRVVGDDNGITQLIPNIQKYILYTDGQGRELTIHQQLDGQYSSLHNPDYSLRLVDGEYVLNRMGNELFVFNLEGRLLRVETQGVKHFYHYDTSYRLAQITHENGNYLRFEYASPVNKRIVKVFYGTENEKLVVEYSYNTKFIASAKRYFETDVVEREYTYGVAGQRSNSLLTSIKKNGHTYVGWDYDSTGRATASYHFLKPCVIDATHDANNCRKVDVVNIDYSNIDLAIDPSVTVSNNLGRQTTYHFAEFSGLRKITQIEGHQSANCAAANKNYSYYPNGQVQTKTDWKNNTTSYQYNTRNLESSRIEALGTPQERTITTEWHPTFNLRTKITEPGKETIFIYDTEGRLLSQSSNETPSN